ncbi:hypothetical protein GOP47_0014722 [Adiantum capillus-veneris]|uniref:DCD domain-containing protein n=1 Tax=Adiantum capillus-veneris TaxID=13818 RepID=A0A9D4UMK6_ADICA|nr:hypothetical protein GOP47_0014722 [Adiantum capillus-veneris]
MAFQMHPANDTIAGLIVVCNNKTKDECFKKMVFGFNPREFPSGTAIVESVKKGAKLFLFQHEFKTLEGIYEATSDGYVDRRAFRGKYTVQIPFRFDKAYNIPLQESEFENAGISWPNYNFMSQRVVDHALSAAQVHRLSEVLRNKYNRQRQLPPPPPRI